MNRSLSEIAEAVGGKVSPGDGPFIIKRVVTDSREVTPGSLFFALKGENHDGHDYIDQVFSCGGAAVVSRPVEGGPSIEVEDCLEALQKLAAYHRNHYEIPVIAVTGSVGKTTTKDLLAACLNGNRKTLKTPGNYNNEIGLPLTLLGLEDEHQACVIELAMRGEGEISLLSRIARPTGCIIVNVAPVHLETMGTLENIVRAKCEVLSYTRDFAVINGDLPELREASFPQGVLYRFGHSHDCDWRVVAYSYQPPLTQFILDIMNREVVVSLPFPATHLSGSVAAAVGTAMLLGVGPQKIKEGLIHFQPSAGRLNLKQSVTGITIIDDSYNANPLSMKAALQALRDWAENRRKIAVLGDMFELGSYEAEGHRSVGEAAAAIGPDILLAIGERARYLVEGAKESGFSGVLVHFDNKGDAISFLGNEVRPGDVILVKASRGMHLEEIVEKLLQTNEPDSFGEA
ncbi:MAG: UDP-N-acetylmuramoyl-tripeptide--D-alanyl-D-alanine ligase [Bacillota bacterium]